MEKRISITFPGNQRVDARMGEFTVRTDQLQKHGGEGSAPSPLDLLFASLATCAGISALGYLRKQSLSTAGLEVVLVAKRHDREPRYDRVRIEIGLPEGFPEARLQDFIAAVSDCAVKRHILHPPAFEVVPTIHAVAPAGPR